MHAPSYVNVCTNTPGPEIRCHAGSQRPLDRRWPCRKADISHRRSSAYDTGASHVLRLTTHALINPCTSAVQPRPDKKWSRGPFDRQLTIAGHHAQARGEAIHAAHVVWSEHSPAPTAPAGAACMGGMKEFKEAVVWDSRGERAGKSSQSVAYSQFTLTE